MKYFEESLCESTSCYVGSKWNAKYLKIRNLKLSCIGSFLSHSVCILDTFGMIVFLSIPLPTVASTHIMQLEEACHMIWYFLGNFGFEATKVMG